MDKEAGEIYKERTPEKLINKGVLIIKKRIENRCEENIREKEKTTILRSQTEHSLEIKITDDLPVTIVEDKHEISKWRENQTLAEFLKLSKDAKY